MTLLRPLFLSLLTFFACVLLGTFLSSVLEWAGLFGEGL